jgi:hypothetical protein
VPSSVAVASGTIRPTAPIEDCTFCIFFCIIVVCLLLLLLFVLFWLTNKCKLSRSRATTPVDDDEEWGWREEGSSNKGTSISSVEMTPSGHHTTLHNRSKSPGSSDRTATLQHRGSFGQGSSSNNPGGAVENTKPRGLPVKKIGMNNPLHAAGPSPPLTRPMTTTASTKQQQHPVVKKLQPPKNDDFFEEMGFNTKPTFKPSSSISAVVPPTPPPSSGNADWGDDGDLDDLLDD